MSRKFFSVLLSALVIVASLGIVLAMPNGGSVTDLGNQTAPSSDPGSLSAIAGNVTEVDVSGTSTTQAWQGYYGNVTGVIQLADGSSNVMYNWSSASPDGEVYASTNDSVNWGSITCFNMTANLSDIESEFGIDSNDKDGVDETFNLNNHAEFYTGTVHFTAGECNNTKVYDNTGAGAFDEVLLTDGSYWVFASLLQNDATGFDGKTHDFEMLVPENGHDGDSSTTTYYFYVELE